MLNKIKKKNKVILKETLEVIFLLKLYCIQYFLVIILLKYVTSEFKSKRLFIFNRSSNKWYK